MQKGIKCKIHLSRELRGTGRSSYKIGSASWRTYWGYKKRKKNMAKLQLICEHQLWQHTKLYEFGARPTLQNKSITFVHLQIMIKDVMQENQVKEIYASATISTWSMDPLLVIDSMVMHVLYKTYRQWSTKYYDGVIWIMLLSLTMQATNWK